MEDEKGNGFCCSFAIEKTDKGEMNIFHAQAAASNQLSAMMRSTESHNGNASCNRSESFCWSGLQLSTSVAGV